MQFIEAAHIAHGKSGTSETVAISILKRLSKDTEIP
jgi:hypothetical protein